MRNLSEHARLRCDQRGIDNAHIALALEWGADIDQHDGSVPSHFVHAPPAPFVPLRAPTSQFA